MTNQQTYAAPANDAHWHRHALAKRLGVEQEIAALQSSEHLPRDYVVAMCADLQVVLDEWTSEVLYWSRAAGSR